MPGWRKVFLRPCTLRESGKDGRRDAREGIVRFFFCSFSVLLSLVFSKTSLILHCLISKYLDGSITRLCAPILDDSTSDFSSFIFICIWTCIGRWMDSGREQFRERVTNDFVPG